MGLRAALGFDSARQDRGARNYLTNDNDPTGTVGPSPLDAGRYPGGGPIMGTDDLYVSSAWHGWPDEWHGTPLEQLGGVTYPSGHWSGFGYGRQSPGGYLNRVSIVGTCVDLNTRQLASFPVYGVTGTQPVPLPTWSINPEPALYADWSEMMKAAVNSIQLAGEIVLWAVERFANGFPARFVVLNPGRVTIEVDDGRIEYALDGEPLNARDVLHIKYQAVPGSLRGVSPLQWLGRNLVSASTLEAYATDIAQRGVWAVLKHPSNLNSTQRDDAKRAWSAARRAMPAAPAVLSGGWEFDTVSLSPTDMALLDLRVFDEQRIASAFGVPPFLVGLEQPGGMTYANASSLFDFHWRATLRPLAQSIANALSGWLLPRGTRVEFNRDEYVRPGLGERAQAYAVLNAIRDAQDRPAIEVDEIRVAERFEPYGDPTTTARPSAIGGIEE